ncbi:MAG: TlpA family protein disulfide reductase [Ignavibacteriales bacterium]|nr:TlpA family protein disulfide reductase [Ignavibacteriales bacterium]
MTRLTIFLTVITIFFIASCTKKEPQDPQKVLTDFRNEENLDKKITIYEEFKETNPEDKLVSSLLNSIVNEKSKNGQIKEAADFLNENEEFATTRIYNGIAWRILESKENLDLGLKLAQAGVDLAREELKSLKGEKPENMSDEDWKKSKEQNLGFILDTYGCIERELGKSSEALNAFKESVNLTNEEIPELNENYVNELIKNENFAEAKTAIENFISSGTNTSNMKLQLKDIFVKDSGNENGFDSYLAEFEKVAKQKMIEKLNSEIIEKPAPQFTLTDLDGKTVSLNDFKGKTVILDFWATWCNPCLQSFPAMQKAVLKFEKDNSVKFLFANTWERVENKKQNAVDFIQNNKYPFHVLLDDQNEVVGKYEVEGIPTKFIIDKNQNIRFKSVGYSGNEDELVEELSHMIAMIK